MADDEFADPVRSSTPDAVLEDIDRQILNGVREYAGRSSDAITPRIDELDKEWDIERLLELNASALAFLGTILAVTISKRWFLLPAVVLAFLFQHAVQGWCPPAPIFRRLGARTRKEIEQEKYALKTLRGDFGPPAGRSYGRNRSPRFG